MKHWHAGVNTRVRADLMLLARVSDMVLTIGLRIKR